MPQPDFELVGEAVIDEDQFQEQGEELQFEMQGDSESIDTAQDQNEERNEQLGIISRGIMTIARVFIIVLAAITLVAASIVKLLDIFDISFAEFRTALVSAIKSFVDDLLSQIPGFDQVQGQGPLQRVQTGVTSGLQNTAPLLAPSISGAQEFLDKLDIDLSVLTSRDQMTGDSTQQDQETDTNSENEGGWGVPFF